MAAPTGGFWVDPKQIVEEGYDELGPRYAGWSLQAGSSARAWFLSEVLRLVGSGEDVLELGCGPGTTAATLAEGRAYTGVDLSSGQLVIARQRAPEGRFLKGDLTRIELPDASFDVVVAFFVFNHVPRHEQGPTFVRVFRWLRPGGRLMCSLGAGDTFDEVQEDWLGVPMFFAGFDVATNERSLLAAGFELELSETRTEIEPGEGEATFHWVIARKPARERRVQRFGRSFSR